MKKILFLVLTVVLLTAIFVGTILCTETGLLLMKKTINSVASPFFTIGNVKGKLSGEWTLYDLVLDVPSVTVSVSRVDCRLRPAKFLEGELGLVELIVEKSKVSIRDEKGEDVSSDSPFVLPKFFLPFGFVIENIKINDLSIVEEDGGEILLIERAGFHLSGKSHQLRIKSFFLKGPDFDLTLHGSLDFSHDWNLDFLGGYRFSGAGFENLSGTFSLNGPLDNPSIELGLHQPTAIRAVGSITHLLEDPEFKMTILGNNVDLSALSSSWPEIRLTMAEIYLFGGTDRLHSDILAEGNWEDLKNIHVASSMSFKSNWQGIDFKSLSLTGEDGTVTARDSWISWADTFRWGGSFFFENFNPELFTEELSGKFDAEISSEGKVVENGVEASFEILRLEGTLNQQQMAIQGSVFLTETEVYTDGLQIKSGGFQGSALIHQGSFSWADTFGWSADISFNDFDPSVLYPELPGQVNGRVTGEGQLIDQKVEGSLTVLNLSGQLRDQRINGGGNIEFRNGRLKTKGVKVQHGNSKLLIRGTAGERFALDFTLSSPDISQFIPVAEGAVSIEGWLTGTQQEPELKVIFDAQELVYGEHSISALKGQGQLRFGGVFNGSLQTEKIETSGITMTGGSVEIAGSVEKHEMSLQLSSGYGELQVQAKGGYGNKVWEGSLPGGTFSTSDYGTWKLINSAALAAGVDGFKLADFCLAENGTQICLDGQLDTTGEDLYWQVKSSLSGGALAWLNRWQFFPVVVSGILNGRLEAEGDSKEVLQAEVEIDLPEADFEVGESGEELRHILLDDTRFTGSIDDNGFQGALYSSMKNGSIFQMSAEIDNLGKFSIIPEQLSMTGEVTLKRVDLDFLAPLTDYLLEPTGKINGFFSLSGSVIQPRANGELSIVEGGIALPNQGVTLEDVKLTLSTEENGARLNCEASSGGGKLNVSGKVEYTETGILGDLTIRGKDFLLLSLPEYEIQITPDMRFLFSNEKGELSGTVKIPTAQITPEEMTSSVTVSKDVILVNDGEEVREPYWPLSIRLSVQLGEDVRIDGYGLKGRLAGGLELQDVPGSFLTATGGLDFIDSSFTIFGRSFDIERGRVLFTGGAIDNPGIDVRAQKKVSAEEAKGDGYVVGVDVNGLVQNLQFHLFSDPFMEDTDILSHLVVGHSLAGSSAEENSILGAAAVALGVEGGAAIFRRVGDLFSVDDLHLEGTSEKEDMSLVVGKRITKDLYFGYDINMFSQLGVFRVRYGLARGFSIETQTSTESTGTDILYTFER